ncbi:DUF6777 domain-containing protein [Streptomyces sp. NPDC020875]|uniref:DUF6777 domain-containing protein n=1 Tax=Streptomyces sp. NPDC020875 TaxID=3154898 RepID=UPI00340A62A8
MSAEPPPSERPTGPPSGPLAGPDSAPPPTRVSEQVPAGPSGPGDDDGDRYGGGGGGSGGGGDGGGPGKPKSPDDGGGGGPWWRSAPRVALLSLGVVAAVAVILVLTLPGDSDEPGSGTTASGEIFLQAASATGPDPYTASTAKESRPLSETAQPTGPPPDGNEVRSVSGATPGLYGGTRDRPSCDVQAQIGQLAADGAKNAAFAEVLGIEPNAVPDYVRSLTPVQLRIDARVTNHGWRDGATTTYQAVLQAGTAVLVDTRGVPRVRCNCGNPLTRPVAQSGTPRIEGDAWPGYSSDRVVVVAPATKHLSELTVLAPDGGWFTRPTGSTGSGDRPTKPPEQKLPSSPPPSDEPSDSASPSASDSASPSKPDPDSSPPSSKPAEPGSSPPPEESAPGQVSPPPESPPESPRQPEQPYSPGGTPAAPDTGPAS